MIDLDKLFHYAMIAIFAGSLVLITHLLTVEVMFSNFKDLNREVHSTTIENRVSDFPIPRGNSLDSLAYCIMKVMTMEQKYK
tara:strand:- start:1480 stop:1725 length:246 start_codon:yes stop_codon:yes gene_type:complete